MNLPLEKLRGQGELGVGLAMVAGYVDGFGLLTFHMYLSFMSGDTTRAGCGAGRGDFASTIPLVVAIVCFVAGVIVGRLLRESGLRRSRQMILGGVGVVLAAAAGGMKHDWLPDTFWIGTISLAMGTLNTAISRVGNEPLNITFVTGTLSKLGNHLALAILRTLPKNAQGPWDTELRRAGLLASVWAAFLFGAVLAGMATPRLAGWALFQPAIVLFALALFAHNLVSDDVE